MVREEMGNYYTRMFLYQDSTPGNGYNGVEAVQMLLLYIIIMISTSIIKITHTLLGFFLLFLFY